MSAPICVFLFAAWSSFSGARARGKAGGARRWWVVSCTRGKAASRSTTRTQPAPSCRRDRPPPPYNTNAPISSPRLWPAPAPLSCPVAASTLGPQRQHTGVRELGTCGGRQCSSSSPSGVRTRELESLAAANVCSSPVPVPPRR